MKQKILLITITTFLITWTTSQAQPALKKDFSYVMEIPSVISMGSSPAHLYTLSDTEGMVVFRTQPDSLLWLYSSTGMEQRGHTMTADVRFAYLYGDSRRLTVLEPTSILGVYSSTQLPARPLDAKRIEQNLYVALGEKGLGRVSLKTPAAVDSAVTFVNSTFQNESIVDLEASDKQLFVLSDAPKLYRFNYNEGELSLAEEFELSAPLTNIHLINNSIYGSGPEGDIYEVNSQGKLSSLGSINEGILQVASWKDWLIIQGTSNRLWTSYQNRRPVLWKKDAAAGNYFTITDGQFWLSEYDQISRITEASETTSPSSAGKSQQGSTTLALEKIPNHIIPHSEALLLPILLEDNMPADAVQFTYQSPDIENAEIRGQSFLWQPSANDVGSHRVKVIATTSSGATDSTTFSIEVRSFNAPPRFAPVRPVTIPLGEEFELPLKAVDPDGITNDLIRFLGVDMPAGATIDEETGSFTWTPSVRQTGKTQFRVIATDQYGAASSVDVTINVVENPRLNSGR